MWVRGRNATIRFTATNPADTITFEIQDGAGAVVHTVTSSAPAADGVFVYPVPYQVRRDQKHVGRHTYCQLVRQLTAFPPLLNTI